MNIITGYRAEPHITAQQLRNTYIGIFGQTPRIIKGVGAELAATIISANKIDIADGMVSCQGCTAEIPRGTVESMVIENGTQGMMRTDLIVVRYTKNAGTGVETMELAVIKGTPASSNPQRPSYTSGTISNGDTLVEFPLYDVNINGISITSVELLLETVNVADAISTMHEQIKTLQKLSIKAVRVDFGSQGFDSKGVIDRSMNVASKMPAGYKLLCALPLHSGSARAVIYSCTVTGPSAIRIQVKRLDSSLETTEAHAIILCVNKNMV